MSDHSTFPEIHGRNDFHHHHEVEHQPQLLTLAGLAYRRRWSALAFRAALHPEEIDQLSSLATDHDDDHDTTSTDGWTLLHWVCCNAPPIEMLQSLFRHESAKRAARMQDATGMTPLLCACACQASLEIISLLVEVVPECIHIYDHDGWTPLHYICSQVRGGADDFQRLDNHNGDVSSQNWAYSMVVVQRLLQCDPCLALVQDCYQRSSIKLLCGLYEVEFHSFYFLHARSRQEGQNSTLQQQEQQLLLAIDNTSDRLTLDLVGGLWRLLQVMIDAAFSHDPIRREATILHRIVAIPNATVDLLMFALALYSPNLALQQDAHGNTPLHVAIVQQQVQHDEDHVLRVIPNRSLIHMLLLHQPQAAQVRNTRGMLPLQYMLDQPWNSIHAALLNAFPAAVETCGLNDEHYVHVLALLCRTNMPQSSSCNPQTIYEMLRARPNLVMVNIWR